MKPITRTVLRYVVLSVAALVTICALVGSWISFQGRREWAATKAELLARGEKLSLVELAPPEIPDDQNFFADPLWEEVSARDENGAFLVPHKKRRLDVLREDVSPALILELDAAFEGTPFRVGPAQRFYVAPFAARAIQSLKDSARRENAARLIRDVLAPAAPLLDEIEALLQRPSARAPIAYDLGFRAPLDHITYFLDISRAFSARAIANLVLGEPDTAAKDVLATLRLADALRSEPILFSQMVRETVLRNALSAIDAGISLDAWTASTLVQIQPALVAARSLDQLELGLRGERGNANTIFGNLHAGPNTADNVFHIVASLNSGPVQHRLLSPPEQAAYLAMFRPTDQAIYNRSIQEWLDILESSGESGIDPSRLRDPSEELLAKTPVKQRFYFTILSLSNLHAGIIRSIQVQEKITLTLIACALDRYRLKHGAYPETLRELEPEFLTSIPRPAIAGQTFHYEPLGDTFRLRSDGWNQIDDGGKVERDARDGDWVWGTR